MFRPEVAVMKNWLARLWHTIRGWVYQPPSPIKRNFPTPYHRSNLHGRHR